MALPVGFYGSLQWIGWLSLLDEVALNHWNTHYLGSTINMSTVNSGFIVRGIFNGKINSITTGDFGLKMNIQGLTFSNLSYTS